jgi:ABC-type transport system involved in cytochrome bd biosynthesis fused ATPase/permease subunit
MLNGLAGAAVILCLGAAVLGVLVLGVDAVHQGLLAPVNLAVLPLAVIGTFEAVPAVGAAATRLGEVRAAGGRLVELAAVPAPVSDPADPVHLGEGVPGIEISACRLRYGDDLPWALDHLDLVLAPSGRLGVVGPSGSGKSSIVNLLMRFWPAAEGRAALGGVALEHLTQAEIRSTIGLLAQDADLFAGSIRANIALGRPNAGEEEIAEVLRVAQLRSFVERLPDGLATPVGERGTRVSGGERQRIALARTLLAGGTVWVLDEPTAGLDGPTGERLLDDVMAASARRGVILVTHRSNELAHVDEVAVLRAGRVVEVRSATAKGPR